MFAAMCLEVFNVIFGDTRDPNGAERFLQLNLHNLYRPSDYQATLRAFFPSKPVHFSLLYSPITAMSSHFVFNEDIFHRDSIAARMKRFPSIQSKTKNF